ncbi:sensor histidine kinase KdpD [Eggerthellaceae bacterium 24-137]
MAKGSDSCGMRGEIDARRDPDAILRRIREEGADEADAAEGPQRGKLKVFFGYAAGVGKTYAMLTEAHRAQEAGADVVVGYVEPHTRADTLALLDGLEVMEPRAVEHRGIALREFDLDGALARAPQIVLVDELAHTNAPGCRHRKRYQDIEELLRAGIDVYTTVNVQHLEGLNDKIAAVTAVAPAERIPDRLFDAADSVEIVDVEPAELIERLRAGKIYAPERVGTALAHFFSRPNLAALREIALRRAADRLTRASTEAAVPHAAGGEDVLVLVTGDAGAPRVIRTAVNLADAFHGSCTALVVESGGEHEGGDRDPADEARDRAAALAEELGARVVTLTGDDPVQPLALYAATAGIRRIVVPAATGRVRLLGRSDIAWRLMRAAPEAMVTAVPAVDAPSVLEQLRAYTGFRPTAADGARAVAAVGLATIAGAVAWAVSPTTSVILMIYLLVALLIATRADGFLYAVLTALGSVVAYNFFFTAPRFTFHAYGLSAPIIFAFLLMGTLAASSLAIRLKRQAAAAARRSYRTEVLLESSRKLQASATLSACLETAAAQVVKILDRPVVMYQTDSGAPGGLLPPRVFDVPGTGGGDAEAAALTAPGEAAVASWVAANGEPAGATTDTLRETRCLYLPIRTKERVYGVAGLVMEQDNGNFGSFERNLLVALLDECGQQAQALASAADRRNLSVKAEKEALRSNLLRAISHDLRTPLTSISGDADMLLSSDNVLDEAQRHRLASDIYEDATWLIDLVENLLSVTRLDDGDVEVARAPELVADVLADALRHTSRAGADHCISVALDDEFLMADMDGRLIVQVVVNLVNNAIAYTPAGSSIRIAAERQHTMAGDRVVVSVADDGPGIPPLEKGRVFDLFYHGGRVGGAAEDGEGGDARRGMGLGLALCRSILRAHGSEISLRDAYPHGCVFSFSLPAADMPASGVSNATGCAEMSEGAEGVENTGKGRR